MNDFRATVILIRWNKHSNQMEAGPGGLGEGLGRDPRFSLALTLPAGGSHCSVLRTVQALGPGHRTALWLPIGLPAARRALGRAAL